jgi:hypothetical protein
LVDDLATRSRPHSNRTELPVCGDGRQTLVDDPDRYGSHRGSDRPRVRESCVSCGTAAAVHRQWQADDYLDRRSLDDKRRDPAQIVSIAGPVVTAAHGLDRRCEHCARIARRDSDPDAADVNPQPNPWSKLSKLPSVAAGHDGRRVAHALATRC